MLRRPIPAGTVTFLFSDLEGGAQLWQAHPQKLRAALERHDDLMREAIVAAGGFVFKTMAHAFFVAFSTATEALEAVLCAQLSLVAEPWPEEVPIRARMALHTGAVESRDDDYFGPPVNRVARLLSTAHAGQIVMSQTTFDLVRDHLTPGATLRDLGTHQLKDLARPEQVFQLTHPRLPSEFPPLHSLSTHSNNLPQQLTTFVGREKESEEIKALLVKSRLVTLLGSGGTGKTRLSLQVGADILERFSDGVWFVELAPLSDPALVARAVAEALKVKETAGEPILSTLIESLKSKSLLIVLDNCEHVVGSSASFVADLLRRCSDVSVLASSREALGVSGEHTYRVPSLSLPDPKKHYTSQSLSQFESARLFIDRANLVKPDFEVTNKNAPALASICYHLDGIPLAIELAAARVRTLSVEDIESKLDQRFRLLTGGSRTAMPRQQTLRALVDWSYDLLSESEKVMLLRVSVFSGGWTLADAEAVCSSGSIEEWEILDLLSSLSDKSLVNIDSDGEEASFRLLETVRQYALERLQESGELEELRHRHMRWMREVAQNSEKFLRSQEQARSLAQFDNRRDNFRAALEWALETESEDALWLVGSLWRYWHIRAHIREGRVYTDRALSMMRDRHSPKARAETYVASGTMALAAWDYETHRDRLLKALEVSEGLDETTLLATIHNGLGIAYSGLEDWANSNQHYDRALVLYEKMGDRIGFVKVLSNKASNASTAEKIEAYRRALTMSDDQGSPLMTAMIYGNLGVALEETGDRQEAKSSHQKALALRFKLNEPAAIAGSLEGIGRYVAFGLFGGDHAADGARFLGASDLIREETGYFESDDLAEENVRAREKLNEALGQDAFEKAWLEGRTQPLERIVEIALAV